MKKRFAICAVCLGMLGVFLYIGSNAQNVLTAQKNHDNISNITDAPSAEIPVPLNHDTLLGGLWTRGFWSYEKEYWVALYQTAAGGLVIRVSSAQEKDAILQELTVNLPGEVVGISGFSTSHDNRTQDSGSGTTDDGDGSNPDVCEDGPDIIISCGGASGGEIRKFLYLWDSDAQAFDEEPVELPVDYVSVSRSRPVRIFSRTWQEGTETHRTLYQIVVSTKDIVPLRSYVLNREEETLEIRDELRHRTLFSGSILLDESGNLQNKAYFDCFFSTFSYVTKPWEPDPNIDYEEGIPVYIAEYDEYGHMDHHKIYYPDRESLLSEQGFSGQEPFYQYTNTWGDLDVELYFNPSTQTGCGFYYDYEFYPEQEQLIIGYVFHGIDDEAWVQYQPYVLENRYGETGKEWLDDGKVLSYEEDCRYRADGRPVYFCAKGLTDFHGDGPEETIFLEIDFVYRNDGSLACREYSHNSWMWGSSFGSGTYIYDEKERLIYENLYVTHGGMALYYIYEDDSDQPAYALMLDSGGTWGCGLFRVE